jgi:hypothetical protein
MNSKDTSLPPVANSTSVGRLVFAACILTLVAIVLMSWSVLDPTPLPVMMALSVGEGIGTLGLLCYLAAVLLQQRATSKARRTTSV